MKGAERVWRLIVWNVPPGATGLMHRLSMIPAKAKPTTFWREYPIEAKDQVLAAIETLRAAGLHGVAKRGEKQAKRPIRHFPSHATSREGFGGALNARPIAGSWRRRPNRR